MYRPVGYTYEADLHCPACASKRFPTLIGTDSEGNDVGAVFPWEVSSDEYCGDCFELLD